MNKGTIELDVPVSTDASASEATTAIRSDENTETENSSDAGRPATEYEIKTLRHVTDRIPLRVWLVALISAAERFTYWSTQATWQNYIQHSPGDQIRGALGLGQAAGLTINSAFNVVIYILPIFIAPIADGRLGRYRTLQICTCFYLAGMGVLLGTSTPAAMRAGASLPGFIVALLLASIGLGGVQAVTTPLIADQYDETVARIAYKKNGERVVIDRDMTIHYIYSIYYWLANAASLGAIPSTLLEKYFSFWSAYILTTGVLSLSILVLWFGKPYFTNVIWIGATSNFNLDAALPENQLERGKQVSWDANFVKDIRQGLMAVKICSLSIVQAGQMQTIGIPNDLLTAFNSLALVIVGLLVENWLYPFLEKRRIHFFVMKRITLGLFFMALSMAYGALVQGLVYNAPPCYNFPLKCHGPDGSIITTPNRVNVLVQLPLYVLVAVSEVFAFVTGSAYTYQKAPHNMKSILQSFYAFMSGVGYLLAVAISPAAKDPNLVIIWSVVAGLTGATTIIFYACFRHYDKIDTSGHSA
ncbi:hypothetical protein F5Y03DRAFT_408689 [Xylaria venustula]|nr:hypothetical protein F5Y03DRAFT_408689 [Xylaria venustula]